MDKEEIEKRFEEIAQEASNQASSVQCSVPEYIEGLLAIRETINMDLDAAGHKG